MIAEFLQYTPISSLLWFYISIFLTIIVYLLSIPANKWFKSIKTKEHDIQTQINKLLNLIEQYDDNVSNIKNELDVLQQNCINIQTNQETLLQILEKIENYLKRVDFQSSPETMNIQKLVNQLITSIKEEKTYELIDKYK